MKQQPKVFLFLVTYRWASLVPGVWFFIAPVTMPQAGAPYGLIFVIAAANTLLITLFHQLLNRQVLKRPSLLGVDMLLSAILLASSGGTHSPYYLYALSPVLAGAFFFQMRGALVSAGVFTPLYLAAALVSRQWFGSTMEADLFFTQLAGIWLLAILVGYPSILLQQLRSAHDDLKLARDDLERQNQQLSQTHHQLEIIYDLTRFLQAAPDVQTVQERVLRVVTQELGFQRAVIGLVNPISDRLESWQAFPETPAEAIISLPLDENGGYLAYSLLTDAAMHWFDGTAPTGNPALDSALDRWLGPLPWLYAPFKLREHTIGILLAAGGSSRMSDGQRLTLLEPVASQATVALGTTMMCIDRARRLAIEHERNRIARDIHDTVAQSLFGIVFTLDACIQLLPENATQTRDELIDLRDLASQVRHQVRHSIYDLWPAEMTLERFVAELTQHAGQTASNVPLQVEFTTRGDFDRLPANIRRTLYQVAQEALTNVAHHASVDRASVYLEVTEDQAILHICDDGMGFDPANFPDEESGDGFGLRGIRERAQALGGDLQIDSQSGGGTRLVVRLPLIGADCCG